MNIKSSVYTFLVLALGFTACIKKEVTPLKDEGATFVKILGGSSPAVVKSNPIDFVTTPQTIVVCSPDTGVTGDQFDGVTSGTFAAKFNAWFTGTDLAFPDWS